MRTVVKLCGFQHPREMAFCAELDIDYVGFILVPGRRRSLTVARAIAIMEEVPAHVQTVGVLQNPTLAEVEQWWDQVAFDRVQLHGQESPEQCATIYESLGVPIVKALQVKEAKNPQLVQAYAPYVQAILVDAGAGGTGESFSWGTIPLIVKIWGEAGIPVWIAGGLQPDNVERLLTEYYPAGVDVSSGIEHNGYKDTLKMKQFVERVRRYDS
ncbi:phosphoribosylanthranilate isomerase [Mechercharimyces sp. CAU 1602]|uniref:phosphoribosylanthranilate isomerase n=1 Tax=Mechercharimyces sp. CAU 1602 TaxID=2973933 RepID=UPI002162D499|nr:phosphoribosylanthranilate isomerase [Mechercharimyces sp. CAU 1602]MCS1350589.1 phosphoribosylanthranilate isomerase [Mechercharimyces sp. CAU 1602]